MAANSVFVFRRGAVLVLPGPADGELVEAEHVHDAYLRRRRRRRVRGAGVRRRRRGGRRCCRRRWRACPGEVYLLAMSHSAKAMKSSKTFCFLSTGAGLVPGLAVLAAAAQAGLGVDAAHLHPDDVGRGELGHEGDVEAAVPVEEGRRGAVEGETLFVGEEHGDVGAVLAGGEDLFRLEERDRREVWADGRGWTCESSCPAGRWCRAW